MTNLQPLSQQTDRRGLSPLEAFDLQQHQILLRLNAGVPCRDLAHSQESANLIAQVGQRPIVDSTGGWQPPRRTTHCCHSLDVTESESITAGVKPLVRRRAVDRPAAQ